MSKKMFLYLLQDIPLRAIQGDCALRRGVGAREHEGEKALGDDGVHCLVGGSIFLKKLPTGC